MIDPRLPIIAVLTLSARPVWAGDRPLSVLFVDMTEDPSPAAKTCIDQLRARLAAADTELARLDRAVLRQRLGAPLDTPFLAWSTSNLAPARARKDGSRFDALVLADCRPEHKQLDVLVVPTAEGRVVLQLREIDLDRRALAWLGGAILRRAWLGFSP